MYEQVDKSKENKSRAIGNAVGQKKSERKQGFRFVDNRPEALAQKKLQEMANNSPQIKQAVQLQVMTDNYYAQEQYPIQKKSMDSSISSTIQLKRYTVARNLKLNLGMKEWKDKTKKNSEVVEQSAKTRARGEALSHLREAYPTSDNSTNDDMRGKEFAVKLESLNKKYALSSTDKVGGEAYSTRAAIYKDAPDGKRSGGTQAAGAIKITGNDKYIGAHLVKREWGGADNMWNVVAWLEDAEKHWAANFERPVDMRGIFGEDPGSISIEVEKEDELIKANAHEDIIKKPVTVKTRMEKIATARSFANRAVESVPLCAIGKNTDSTTALNAAITGYDLVVPKAQEYFTTKVKEAEETIDERDTYSGNRPLPDSMAHAQSKEDARNLDERRKDWEKEKETYDAGGKDAFKYTNTII